MRTQRILLSGLSFAALSAMLFEIAQKAQAAGYFAGSLKWKLGALAGLGLDLLALGVFILAFTPAWVRLGAAFGRIQGRADRMGWLNLLPPALLGAVYLLLVYFLPPAWISVPSTFQGLWARVGLVWLFGLAASPFLRAFWRLTQPQAVLAGVYLLALLHHLGSYFSQISASPFTLAWSEANRFYYASLFLAPSIYGQRLPLPFLDPSRFLLLSAPYLFGLPIWAHRLWESLLWVGLTALTAWLLVRRLRLAAPFTRLAAAAWAFLFLLQVPVYYYLLLCAIPVLAWFDRRRFLRSLLVVLAASLWAGISRVNWYPLPGLLAAMLYLLETPLESWKKLPAYLLRPLAWLALGTGAAAGTWLLYMRLSGQPDSSVYSSTFVSGLLWYRLLPSPTYPPGILPMTLLLSAPLLGLLAVRRGGGRIHPLRLLGLGGMLLAVLVGGLVVSTKIGGGSNLHNLDVYFVLLLAWGASVLAGRAVPEPPTGPAIQAHWAWLLLILAMPLTQVLLAGQPVTPRSAAQEQAQLSDLRQRVCDASASGEVLFIYQRQLLAFHQIEGVRPVSEYDVVDLMEMAMANNRAYLTRFAKDMNQRRFALIVTDPENGLIRYERDSFPEENNLWNQRVYAPLKANYHMTFSYPDGTQIWEPLP